METSDKLVLLALSLMFLAVLATGTWHFWIDKQYPFLIEAACDPSTETCFERDCSIPDECPPNNLSTYKMFFVIANDFEKCSDNSCAIECASGIIECEELICGASEDDICAEAPVEPMEQEPAIEEEVPTIETVPTS